MTTETEHKEPCPECATPSPMTYGESHLPLYPVQGVKAGGFSFFECPSCGHSWAVSFDLTPQPPGTFTAPPQ